MKRMLVVASLCLCAVPALAQGGRPNSWTLTCDRARMLVLQAGSVVMNFSPTTYDRVVSQQNYCLFGEEMIPAYVQTRDHPQCLIGYTCRQGDYRRWR